MRFSLSTLILLVGLCGAAMGLCFLYVDNRRLRSEVEAFERQSFMPSLKDPKKFYRMRLIRLAPNDWRWVIYIPKGRYLYGYAEFDAVPKQGLPSPKPAPGRECLFSLSPGESCIEICLRRESSNVWYMTTRWFSSLIPERCAKWLEVNPILSDNKISYPQLISEGEIECEEEGVEEGPIVLLRFRSHTSEEPCVGFMFWMEE